MEEETKNEFGSSPVMPKPNKRRSISQIGTKVYPSEENSQPSKIEMTKSNVSSGTSLSGEGVNSDSTSDPTVEQVATTEDSKRKDGETSSEHQPHEPISFSHNGLAAYNSMLSEEENDSSDDEGHDHAIVKKLWFVIMPSSPIRIAWDMFILALLAFILVSTPLELAFAEIEHKLEVLALVIDSIFLVDVLINFCTAYRPLEDEDIVEVRLRKIAWKYVTTWFLLDVLSCPSILLLVLTMKGLPSEFSLLKLLKGAKTLKMLKMVKVLKVLRVNKLMGNYALELEELMMRGSVQVRVKLIQLALVVALSAHFLACLWIAVSRTSDGQSSWMFQYSDLDDDGAAYFNEWNVSDQYVTAFYFAIMTMTTVGFGDIVPSSTGERLFMIAAMVVGGGMYGFIIASLASVVTSLDMNQKQYYTKMDTIHSYMSYRKFPTALRHRVHRYFRKFYEVNSALDEKAILNDLPDNLRNEVMKLIVNESVTANYIFQNLPDTAISRLASLFKPAEVDDDRDFIVKRGEAGAMMFIITGGVAEYSTVVASTTNIDMLPENACLTDSPSGILEAGDCFGELVGLGMEQVYNITVSPWSHTPLEVLVATREDILSTFDDEVIDLLRARAWEHTMVTRKVKKKSKAMVGINGSGVGPFDISAFMKYQPINATPQQQLEHHRSYLRAISPLSFLMHHHPHPPSSQRTVPTSRSLKGRGSRASIHAGNNGNNENDNDASPGYYPNSAPPGYINTTKKNKSFQLPSPRRRNTTGDVLLHSESTSFTEDELDTPPIRHSGEGHGLGKEGKECLVPSPPSKLPHRRSVSQSDLEPIRHHHLQQPSIHLVHTPIPSFNDNASHGLFSGGAGGGGVHNHLHHKKYTGATTRGNGGDHLPIGFSDNVFELLEQVLDEVALVNKRLIDTEESINGMKKLQRRSSASSLLFGVREPSPKNDNLAWDTVRTSRNSQSPSIAQSQSSQHLPDQSNRPPNLNVHLAPLSVSTSNTPTGVLLPMGTPTPNGASGPVSPTFSTVGMFDQSKSGMVSVTISMKIQAKWQPLSSYQHPYFRIVRPGSYLRKGHHYDTPKNLPSECIVYQSEVSGSGKKATVSWNPFTITIDNLLDEEKESNSQRSKWDEAIILECWDWNRSTAHNLIGYHYTTVGNLKDINGRESIGDDVQGCSAEVAAALSSSSSPPSHRDEVHDFTLVRADKLEVGKLCIKKCKTGF